MTATVALNISLDKTTRAFKPGSTPQTVRCKMKRNDKEVLNASHTLMAMRALLAERTKNFSGAEIEGLVKSAASFALNRQVDVNDLDKPVIEENIKVGL